MLEARLTPTSVPTRLSQGQCQVRGSGSQRPQGAAGGGIAATQETEPVSLSRPAASERLATSISLAVGLDALVAPALERGSMEVVGELAYPLPATVICELLGVPEGDRGQNRA